MDPKERTEVRVSDTPETDAISYCWTRLEIADLCRRLERERNLALAILRKYYNGPELKDFPNVKL